MSAERRKGASSDQSGPANSPRTCIAGFGTPFELFRLNDRYRTYNIVYSYTAVDPSLTSLLEVDQIWLRV